MLINEEKHRQGKIPGSTLQSEALVSSKELYKKVLTQENKTN